ncbi:MAG: L-histidine N(alpha)-methyltransferase [Nitrososphaerales archaeon]
MPEESDFASDIRSGLTRKKRTISPQDLYDEQGSKLFEQICAQPEYYPTRLEASILGDYHDDIVNNNGSDGYSLVELGSGSSRKTRILLDPIFKEHDSLHYFAIDLSSSAVDESSRIVTSEYPKLTFVGMPFEYEAGLNAVSRYINKNEISGSKMILFLGSSIGNFEPDESIEFLKMVKRNMAPEDILLIGFDLQKDPNILRAAYNDKNGITAKFNKNILTRINRELNANFNLEDFEHQALYNEDESRIEMCLVCKNDCSVDIKSIGERFIFSPDDSIHTENSYKLTMPLISERAKAAGLELQENFNDQNDWYSLALLRST